MRRRTTAFRAMAATIAAASVAGCVTDHGHFTVLSNKLMRTTNFRLDQDRRKDVVGEDVAHIIILIPTKARPTLEEAIDDAMQKGQGDVMTDVRVKTWAWYIPYVYGQTGWEVRGDVVKTRRS